MKTYTIITIEQGKADEPLIFSSKEHAHKTLEDIVDIYKLDRVTGDRYINLQEAIEVTTWTSHVTTPV